MTEKMRRQMKEFLRTRFGIAPEATLSLIISPGGRIIGFTVKSEGLPPISRAIQEPDLSAFESIESSDLELSTIKKYIESYQPAFQPIKKRK
ncbi:MAG: hypothetical protein V1760_01835 [Candidatus Peregrinibacteria bacterium]